MPCAPEDKRLVDSPAASLQHSHIGHIRSLFWTNRYIMAACRMISCPFIVDYKDNPRGMGSMCLYVLRMLAKSNTLETWFPY